MSLSRLRKARGLTQQALAFRSGISQKHISQIERGKADPTIGILFRIATALSVSPSAVIRESLSGGKRRTQWAGGRYGLPVFRGVVAGDPTKASQEKLGELEVLPGQYAKGRYILKVPRNCLYPYIQRGDLVLVDNAARPRKGEIVACTINGKRKLRRYGERDGTIFLWSENPSIAPSIVTRKDKFTVNGVVLELVRRKLR